MLIVNAPPAVALIVSMLVSFVKVGIVVPTVTFRTSLPAPPSMLSRALNVLAVVAVKVSPKAVPVKVSTPVVSTYVVAVAATGKVKF